MGKKNLSSFDTFGEVSIFASNSSPTLQTIHTCFDLLLVVNHITELSYLAPNLSSILLAAAQLEEEKRHSICVLSRLLFHQMSSCI
jgi:hypothetical protein